METPIIKQDEYAGDPRLVYRFIDASVAPQYHRSYTITVMRDRVGLTVDCYGEILAEYTLPLSENRFKKFLADLKQIAIFNVDPDKENGCSGGKTDSFDILFNDVAINGYVYHCAGKKYGNLKGNTDDATRLFTALVPGTKDKIRV